MANNIETKKNTLAVKFPGDNSYITTFYASWLGGNRKITPKETSFEGFVAEPKKYKDLLTKEKLIGYRQALNSASRTRLYPTMPMLAGRIPDNLVRVQTIDSVCIFTFEIDIPSYRFPIVTKHVDLDEKTNQYNTQTWNTFLTLPLPKLHIKIVLHDNRLGKKSNWSLGAIYIYHPTKDKNIYIPMPNVVPEESSICYGSSLDKYSYFADDWNSISNLISTFFQSSFNLDYCPKSFYYLKDSPWQNLTKKKAQSFVEQYPDFFRDHREDMSVRLKVCFKNFALAKREPGRHGLVLYRLALLVWSEMSREEFLEWADKFPRASA